MQEYLIIDGYNIIFAWPEFEKLRKESLEHARAKLVDMFINYSAMLEEKVVLVFDGYLVKNNKLKTESVTDKLEVIYTREGETADSMIERMASELAVSGKVYVATSDWAQQSLVFGLGAYRMTPKELAAQLKKVGNEASRHYVTDHPADSYLENRLMEEVRKEMDKWRKKQG